MVRIAAFRYRARGAPLLIDNCASAHRRYPMDFRALHTGPHTFYCYTAAALWFTFTAPAPLDGCAWFDASTHCPPPGVQFVADADSTISLLNYMG